MEELCNSDYDGSEFSTGSDSHCSSLSLQYSASSFDDASSRESDENVDHEFERVEPYQYAPEDSEEENTMADAGGTDDEGDDFSRERFTNTNW